MVREQASGMAEAADTKSGDIENRDNNGRHELKDEGSARDESRSTADILQE